MKNLILIALLMVSATFGTVAHQKLDVPDLPQTPVAPRAGNDAKKDGVIGKVKLVIEESEYLAIPTSPNAKPRRAKRWIR